MPKKIQINEDFFDAWSPEMAWVLGVIFTDGYFGKTNSKGIKRLYIAQKETELLEKIKDLLGSEHKILTNLQPNRKDKIHYLSFTNERIYNSLIRLGLISKKSLCLKFPDIPHECIRHFLRGCWDGDGSFYYEYDNPARIRADYVSGSYEFMRTFVDYLIELTHTNINIYKKHKNSRCFYIKLSPLQAVKLYPLFYKGVSSTIYLSKKHQKLKKSYTVLGGQG